MSSELGKILKTERESTNLSIQDVSSVLRIHPRILIALEEGDKKNLPALTFVKGFVRNYAFYLKVPADVAMDLYSKEYLGQSRLTPEEGILASTSGPSLTQNSVPLNVPTEKGQNDLMDYGPRKKSGHPIKFYLVFGLSLILIVLTGVLVSQFQNRPAGGAPATISETPTITAPVIAQTPASSQASSPASTALSEPALEKPGAAIAPSNPTELSTLKPAVLVPSATRNQAAPPTPAPLTTAKASDDLTPQPKLPEKPGKSNDSQKSFEVVVETQKPVQLDFSYDGKTFKKLDLAVDTIQTFRTKNKIFLKASDGSAVLVSVNGILRKTKGEAGVPIEMTIP